MGNIKEMKNKCNENVKPALAWGIYGGVLVLAIALALIFWL